MATSLGDRKRENFPENALRFSHGFLVRTSTFIVVSHDIVTVFFIQTSLCVACVRGPEQEQPRSAEKKNAVPDNGT